MRTTTLNQELHLKVVGTIQNKVKDLFNRKGEAEKRIEGAEKVIEEAKKEIALIDNKLDTLSNILDFARTTKGRLPGAKDATSRVRRTYVEEMMQLSLEETIRYRKTGKLPAGKVAPTEREASEWKKQQRQQAS